MGVMTVTQTILDRGLGIVQPGAEDVCAVIGCCSGGSGSELVPTVYSGGPAGITTVVAEKGQGPAVELSALHLNAGAKVVFCKVAATTAGAARPVDTSGVVGTSVITITGTPYDDYEIGFICTVGGTIGVAGIKFIFTADGGQNYSGTYELGAATTFVIPNTGLTLNFAAGTLIANDEALCTCIAPQPSAADIVLAIEAIKAAALAFGFICALGETSATEAGTIKTEMTALESGYKYKSVLVNARDMYRPAFMSGAPSDVDFSSVAHTVTRNTGSWITDGFKVGMTVVGTSALNTGTLGVLTGVSATVLTFASGIVAETNQDGATFDITATEPMASWETSIKADFLNFDCNRMGVGAGFARVDSAINHRPARRLRRPASWFAAVRGVVFDIQHSVQRVKSGSLGVSITDADGTVVEYNEQLRGSLDDARFITLTTYPEKIGVFITRDRLMSAPGSDFTHWAYRRVMDEACRISYLVLVENLGDDVRVNASDEDENPGAIYEPDRLAIQAELEDALRIGILDKERASAVTPLVAENDNLLAEEALHVTTTIVPNPIIGAIAHTIGFVNPALHLTEV